VWKIKEGKLQQFDIFTTSENIKGKIGLEGQDQLFPQSRNAK